MAADENETTHPNREESPVFVVGALRSGTTMFRLMLNNHPEISNPGEFEEAVHMLGDTGWVPMDRFRAHLRTSTQMRVAGFEISETLDYPALVRDIWRQVCGLTDKPIVGASIHSRYDRCPDIWPKARYIHVIRDPRDVARSCIGMGWVGNVYSGARIWIEAEQRWGALAAKVDPSQIHEVRYEDLVSDPEGVLHRVCEFLNIEYSDQMLHYDGSSTYSRPDPKFAEQWRRKQTPREVQQVEWRVGSLLTERGYSLSEHGPHEVGTAELLYLKAQNSVRRVRGEIDRYGVGNWFMYHATQRFGPSSLRHTYAVRKHDIDRTLHK